MNWYLALGIKIFTVIILFFQVAVAIGCSTYYYWWKDDYLEMIICICSWLLFSLTIPTACWVFNL